MGHFASYPPIVCGHSSTDEENRGLHHSLRKRLQLFLRTILCIPVVLSIVSGEGMQLLLLLSLQSCPTLCDPIDGNPPGSPVPGILQARTLEWVAISFSNA